VSDQQPTSSPQPIPPVILICGPAGHGKTTAREALCKLTHLKGGSCSDVVYHYLALLRGVSVEDLRKEDKETLRPELIKVGNWLTGDDVELEAAKSADPPKPEDVYRVPSSLIRTLYHNGRNIIDGVRRSRELTHSIEHLAWNGVRVLTIYVSRTDGPAIADNTEDLSSRCDEHVLNDGTTEDLEKKLFDILCKHFPA